MARFGLSVYEFLRLTPLEFYLALKDNDSTEIGRVRTIAEAIRMSAWWLVNIQLSKGKKIKKEKIMKFAWEFDVGNQTPEQMKRVLKTIAAATKNKKKRKVKK